MSLELKVAHCPSCGKVFQKNLRNLCGECSQVEDRSFRSAELILLRHRFFDNEQVSEAAGVPVEKLRGWIRSGKLRLNDYPNLSDQCDSCKASIRTGHICLDCARRIKSDLAHALEQERLMRERLRAANSYMARK
jgi:ribosomal protein L32